MIKWWSKLDPLSGGCLGDGRHHVRLGEWSQPLFGTVPKQETRDVCDDRKKLVRIHLFLFRGHYKWWIHGWSWSTIGGSTDSLWLTREDPENCSFLGCLWGIWWLVQGRFPFRDENDVRLVLGGSFGRLSDSALKPSKTCQEQRSEDPKTSSSSLRGDVCWWFLSCQRGLGRRNLITYPTYPCFFFAQGGTFGTPINQSFWVSRYRNTFARCWRRTRRPGWVPRRCHWRVCFFVLEPFLFVSFSVPM